MSSTFRALLLAICFSVYCQAQSRTLAVYAVPPQDLDAAATRVMQTELQKLLDPAGIHILWRNSQTTTGEAFDLVVVGSFEGSCVAKVPISTSSNPEGAAILADTSISNGRILPFFRVDCARLVRILDSTSDSGILGCALARVVAHELYHIIANTTAHHDTGLAKAKFSLKDLTSPRFELDMWSVALMKPSEPVLKDSIAELSGR